MDQISLDINDRQDYKPFPSKMFALLFFLVHGPHPIVSICLFIDQDQVHDFFFSRATELLCLSGLF